QADSRQRRAQVPVPGTGGRALALAGGLVVPRRQPSPGGQPRGGGEPRHVAAGLGDDHLGDALADAGDGDQPAMTGWNGAAAAAARTSSSAILTVRWSQASRCSRHIWPCEAVNRPSQAICSPSILRRNTPLARLASTPGLRSPAISASIMVRPDTPSRSLATEPGLDPGVLQHLGQPLALADPPLDELLPLP